ncbi:MAG: serine protease [Pseudotabrizicola sp.]|uniref:trypsin-like serine peptidase n=1 Tax=Pseudotabrizicola sp. TaxID=2939647 RepID=UPI002724DC4C|nr:serine protease [Pseudotabrizicola sp.]MDO8883369.1 serine protease [Pseudotabrizicola sp.]MDP2081296.1 serine protease [Pseudotabrizicola sp.]MDZ7576085.1 serine protease [Pseudotabrizicola sp.]
MEDGRDTLHLPAIDATGAALVAAHFKAGRTALCQVYTEVERRSAGRLRDFKIVALGLQDTEAAFAAALLETARYEVHRTFLIELSSLGFLDLPGALAALEPASRETLLWPQDGSGHLVLPQRWNRTVSATIDMAGLLRAVNLVARRLCFIEADGVEGTGFLIGPQTVITNWHVVANLIDPATGMAREGSAADIVCTFENLERKEGKAYHAVEDWLVDFSPMAGQLAKSGSVLPDMKGLRPHALDFCAIRLAGAPGRERGWYDLSKTGKLNDSTDHFFVFQHPQSYPQRLAITSGAKLDPNSADFLHHKAWTDGGSSGGLCLDHAFRPIGLHHAAVFTEQNVFVSNRAVRLSAIHSACPGLGDADPGLNRIIVLSDRSRAVLGRGKTQDLVQDMMQNAARPIVYVRGQPRSGKSFTAELIRDCAPHDRRRIVRLSASELPVEALSLAQLILTRAGAAPTTVATLPQADLQNGTDNAWIRSTLLPSLRLALAGLLSADPLQPLILWLIIDELDVMAIPQTGARELLDALYADAEAMRNLRVVLIGLDAALPSIDPASVRIEILDAPDQVAPEALESCLAALMTEQSLAPAPAELQRQLGLLNAVEAMVQSMGKGRNRLERLSDVLAQVWLRTVQTWK